MNSRHFSTISYNHSDLQCYDPLYGHVCHAFWVCESKCYVQWLDSWMMRREWETSLSKPWWKWEPLISKLLRFGLRLWFCPRWSKASESQASRCSTIARLAYKHWPCLPAVIRLLGCSQRTEPLGKGRDHLRRVWQSERLTSYILAPTLWRDGAPRCIRVVWETGFRRIQIMS